MKHILTQSNDNINGWKWAKRSEEKINKYCEEKGGRERQMYSRKATKIASRQDCDHQEAAVYLRKRRATAAVNIEQRVFCQSSKTWFQMSPLSLPFLFLGKSYEQNKNQVQNAAVDFAGIWSRDSVSKMQLNPTAFIIIINLVASKRSGWGIEEIKTEKKEKKMPKPTRNQMWQVCPNVRNAQWRQTFKWKKMERNVDSRDKKEPVTRKIEEREK